jgi:hypothetical protein
MTKPDKWEVRMYWRHKGFHTHCRVFTGLLGNSAFCGHLVFSTNEWAKVKETMPGVVLIADGDNGVFETETGDKVP